jgi:hypothetical protein|tara:strand:+ start:2527 stop:4770 length:2244 start_codon:yes stop_codon:yes gene_type:complete
LVLCLAATLISCTESEPPELSAAPIVITSLSNRADLISAGDALLEIQLPQGLSLKDLSVDLNGADVSERFAVRADGRILGLVDGLALGNNTLTATAQAQSTRLTLTNHAKGGPIFSGDQIQPWICATPEAHEGDDDTPATAASGLATAAIDRQCNIAAEVKRFYRTTEQCGRDPDNPRRFIPCFKEFDGQGGLPADMAETTNQQGKAIPYVVRVERGTINRGIYDIAVVEERGSEWGPFNETQTWNGALLHQFGGSTGTPRRQFPPNSRWAMDEALSLGFMVSVSSLTDQALNANKVVAAETVMMLKEHIAESYGEISHTIGSGCSGGSIMQLVIAGTYPGVLDGIQPSCTYPDSITTGIEVTECVLLENYFNSNEFAELTSDLDESVINRKKAAIAGHLDEKACLAWSSSFGHSNRPGNFMRRGEEMNNCRLPRNWVYDAESNPQGVRCSQPDHEIALWGKEPGQEHARRYADNSGVQYGLQALQAGDISAREFVSLNANIGGADVDKGLVGERMLAAKESLALAYRMGFVTDPRQWANVPIIDLRGNDNSSIHMNWRAFAVRDRMDRVLGNHDNQVIWRFGPQLWPPQESNLTEDSLLAMHQWVKAIKADKSDRPLAEKVTANKPATVFDFCYIGDDYTNKVTDKAQCDSDPALAYYSSPRQVAGGPLAENIWKCDLKPLQRSDYTTQFDDAQWRRLEAVFPEGVCDWSKPGVGMQPAVPWLDYTAGPGGAPLPHAPRSEATGGG